MKWIIALLLAIMFGTSGFMLYAQMRSTSWMAAEASIKSLSLPATEFAYSYSPQERHMLDHGLVDIGRLDPRLVIKPVYARADNLTGKVLYKNVRRLFLRPEIAGKLSVAQDFLAAQDSSLTLVILDAARPQHVQYEIWQWAVKRDMQKYIAAPSMGSVHNFGCAVDVTITGRDTLLDMGSPYDHFGPEAEPRYQLELMQAGILTVEQVQNRLLLKQAMRQAGFRAIQTEWWHFNGVSKEYAREHFVMIP